MLPAEFHDLRQSGHGAIRVGHFAEYAARGQAGQTHQVHGGLGVSATLQDPAGSGPQGEYVPRTVDVLGPGAGRGRGLDGPDPIRGGYACGHALCRLDGNGKRGLVLALVLLDHHGQIQGTDLLFFQAEADNAAAFPDKHGHLGFAQRIGGKNEIPLVFPVRIISDQDTAPLLQGLQSLFHTFKRSSELIQKRLIHGKSPYNLNYLNQGIR